LEGLNTRFPNVFNPPLQNRLDNTTSAELYAGANEAAREKNNERIKRKNINIPARMEKKVDFDALLNENSRINNGSVNLPVTEETLTLLLDNVHEAGDALIKKPFPPEIQKYKDTVRTFMNYCVKNGFDLIRETGIKAKYIERNKGRFKDRDSEAANAQTGYSSVQIIDVKLEKLAADIVIRHKEQLDILAAVEEINGLLIDFLG
jgi:uncharacterized protein YaaR (DUF327 family)